MKLERTECSETSAYKIQTPGNHPKEAYNIKNTAKVWNQEARYLSLFRARLIHSTTSQQKLFLNPFNIIHLHLCHWVIRTDVSM